MNDVKDLRSNKKNENKEKQKKKASEVGCTIGSSLCVKKKVSKSVYQFTFSQRTLTLRGDPSPVVGQEWVDNDDVCARMLSLHLWQHTL